jgi:hypothetical protein
LFIATALDLSSDQELGMTIPKFSLLLVSAVTVLALAGQTARPNAYSITETFYLLTKPVNFSIYRDGSKVLVDRQNAPEEQGKHHVRLLYDLQTHNQVFWDVDNPAYCNTAPFQDDDLELGDPFGADVDRFKGYAKEIGTETIHGVATKIYQQSSPGRTVEMWIDPKSGAAMKVLATLDGKTQTTLEVLNLSVGKPPSESFVIPSACAETLKAAPSKPAPKR